MNRTISPSMICMDLCNLEQSVKELEQAGCHMLHVDILDGYFSPSMPVGLDTIRQLRRKTELYFDAHVMAEKPKFFIEELVDIGVGRLCFQVETERHISRTLSYLREHHVEAGVALAPATPLTAIEYVLEQCDFVLLMMINPGFASCRGEKKLEFLPEKIGGLHKMIRRRGLHTEITLDGRIGPEDIGEYLAHGADTLVAGTSSLFLNNGKSLKENFVNLDNMVRYHKSRGGKNINEGYRRG